MVAVKEKVVILQEGVCVDRVTRGPLQPDAPSLPCPAREKLPEPGYRHQSPGYRGKRDSGLMYELSAVHGNTQNYTDSVLIGVFQTTRRVIYIHLKL